jgi:hypothetical protein
MAQPRFESSNVPGFDPSVPWLMVPIGETRAVTLMDGKDHSLTMGNYTGTVSPSNPTVASFIEDHDYKSNLPRTINIRGLSAGGAVLSAWDRGTMKIALDLQVAVLNKGKIKLKFYSVSDEANHRSDRSAASVAEMLKEARRIYDLGPNIDLQQTGAVMPITLPGNQYDVFWIRDAEIRLLQSKVNLTSADLHVFLIWSLESEDPPREDDSQRNDMGYTPKGRGICAIEDDRSHSPGRSAGLIFAHELGHFLGLRHDDADALKDNTNLMHGMMSANTTDRLAKAQILKMYQTADRGFPPPIAL